MTIQEIEKDKDLTLFVTSAFEFLRTAPPEIKYENDGFDFLGTTLEQKLVVDSILAKNKDSLEVDYGKILKTYEPDTDPFKMPFLDVVGRAVFYLEAYAKNQNFLQERLIVIPSDPDAVQAGVNELQSNPFFSRYSLIHSLANENVLNHSQVLKMTIAEVNSWLIYQNMKADFEHKLFTIRKMKNKT